ncbi:hypothetical protein M2171_007655 [Bradyrhizobium japonicum USDA 38]|uniref:DUF6527 family protein n=1 Tax=Bradyrhizobium japonicum TaxID=375 RepID=UPI0004149149|nr:DUF6527 family protein [Bradyrhizobium japonicum]MCS3898522.1 hypothetical protein [Bradyrhizobium japonicum USDA 38]MCS3941575.1 hypothetical protein [Bradyrhizobium japonicum]
MLTVRFTYQAVERLPKQIDYRVLYHSEEFEVAALSCACGCGQRVMLLVPDSHQVSSQDGMATVRPSISVCDAPCKSHYFISAGQVEWLPAFSTAQASNVMRMQIARQERRSAVKGEQPAGRMFKP